MLDDSSEALLNTHMDGDTVVIHEQQHFILRLGNQVLGIEIVVSAATVNSIKPAR
ncbi:hypothetical protein [Neisseria gonorrhoeae]|uniref:hypothetical protein n=1 Tax=Neisseria gonorrhoeae TaxID=485 RepID=UPI0015F11FA0|nr:hypothetical protein [Neisseria gonorrhoeae]